MAPLIGVTTSVVTKEPERTQLNASYILAVQQAGGVPVLLPSQLSAKALVELLQRVDGLVLTGGGDVDSALYGGEPHPTRAYVSATRDALETAVIRFALGQDVPLFAICRGMQILNVALGGSLYQDIPSQLGTDVIHSQGEARDEPCHRVRVEPGSQLAGLVGAGEIDVNSRHHQAVKNVGQGLVPVAWAPDGVVEGLEIPGRWIVGVQWHPEDLAGWSQPAMALFAGVVEAAKRRAR